MFWQKSLILLGLLTAAGSAAPVVPLEGEVAALENATAIYEKDGSLEKRFTVRYVWRADRRHPGQIRAAQGFMTKGGSNFMKQDLSLYRHCKGAKNGASMDNDGYVSTTWDKVVAEGWIHEHMQGTGTIYKIATDENLIDVAATLKKYNPYPHEKEFAAISQIHWSQVQGWHIHVSDGHGGSFEQQYEYNSEFNQAVFGNQPHAGAQFPLAGFPDGHPAWSQAPWALYAHCRPRPPSKRGEEIFARESPAVFDDDEVDAPSAELEARGLSDDFEDQETDTPESALEARESSDELENEEFDAPGFALEAREDDETTTAALRLETRGRSRKARPSRKRPSAAGSRKKTAAKKKTASHKGKTRCTAAMKKAGKCTGSARPKKTCTPAMKKAGKCGTTCTPAMKKAGKCGAPCTPAMKKAGKCPGQKCTAAMAKAGKCKQTCTAAMQKAGKCKKECTPAEKKAGKCKDEKKGQCVPSKPNKDRYQEYLRAVKAKKGGKKMHWSEGGGSTGATGGGKAHSGGKKGGH